MKTMKHFHYLYVKWDVLLVPDVFENFKNRCLENYGLCPSHYLSTPALGWNVMLSMTKAQLNLISVIDMYLFSVKGMRGGVSYISKRYIKSNKKYVTSHDPKKVTKYFTYLDKIMSMLYCHVYAMSKSLPTSEFKWVDLAKFSLDKFDNHKLRPCVLEVDLKYPEE